MCSCPKEKKNHPESICLCLRWWKNPHEIAGFVQFAVNKLGFMQCVVPFVDREQKWNKTLWIITRNAEKYEGRAGTWILWTYNKHMRTNSKKKQWKAWMRSGRYLCYAGIFARFFCNFLDKLWNWSLVEKTNVICFTLTFCSHLAHESHSKESEIFHHSHSEDSFSERRAVGPTDLMHLPGPISHLKQSLSHFYKQ